MCCGGIANGRVKVQQYRQGQGGEPDRREMSVNTDEKGTRTDTIQLIVLYEADGAATFARIHSGGKLLEFKADGQVIEAPTNDLNELYRWLQDHDFIPDMTRFGWLDRNQGNRRRRQVYTHHQAT